LSYQENGTDTHFTSYYLESYPLRDGEEFRDPLLLRYEGQFQDGKKHGQGKIFDKKSGVLLYDGSFENDQFDGKNCRKHIGNGEYFMGTFKDGKMVEKVQGKIFDSTSHRLRYKGFVKDDKRHGYGTEFKKSGTVFKGDWIDGKKQKRFDQTSKHTLLNHIRKKKINFADNSKFKGECPRMYGCVDAFRQRLPRRPTWHKVRETLTSGLTESFLNDVMFP